MCEGEGAPGQERQGWAKSQQGSEAGSGLRELAQGQRGAMMCRELVPMGGRRMDWRRQEKKQWPLRKSLQWSCGGNSMRVSTAG